MICLYQNDNGSPVTNYVVEKMDTKTGLWKPVSKFVRGTEYEVPNLEEGHSYQFRVSAVNQHGVSEPLETSKPTVAQYQFGKSTFKCIVIPMVPKLMSGGRGWLCW